MILIYTIILLLLIFIIYVITQTIKLRLLLDLKDDKINCTVFCLYPFLKIMVNVEDTKPFLIIYLLKIRVYKAPLKLKKRADKGINLYKTVNPNNIEMTTYYGFKDPFTTGIVCGTFSALTKYININRINQFPNFVSTNDYVYVDATANINVGHSILYFVKNKKH